MKAAVCREFGKPLVIEEVTLAKPQAGELRVKIAAATTVVMGIEPLIMPVMDDDTDCSANGYR